ncbi:MAG: hypothetical protein AW12_00663 [Candidatus Accumulibacter sp. BA-94]|nr:MAG: hypothetical protein AW12_00663 [Candidatus Accumulibacter sp. BA-94]
MEQVVGCWGWLLHRAGSTAVTSPSVAAQLVAPPQIPLDRLWVLWDRHFLRRPLRVTRRYRETRLAYWLHAVAYGGLSKTMHTWNKFQRAEARRMAGFHGSEIANGWSAMPGLGPAVLQAESTAHPRRRKATRPSVRGTPVRRRCARRSGRPVLTRCRSVRPDSSSTPIVPDHRRPVQSPVLDGEPEHRPEILQVGVDAVLPTRLPLLRLSSILLVSSTTSEGEHDGRF